MTRYSNQISTSSSAFTLLASVAMCVGTMITVAPGHALAAEAPANRIVSSEEVSFAALDLSEPKDAARAARMLRNAARSVCGDHNGRVDLATASAIQACEARALADAAQKVNSPRVSALLKIKTDTIKVAVR